MEQIPFDTPSRAMLMDLSSIEYEALRATIRQRGSVRVCSILSGIAVWALFAGALFVGGADGGVTFLPLILLAATFELSFFIHTGVERVGRYLQVFYEGTQGVSGWETVAMTYGAKFPGGSDPLFGPLFGLCTVMNFLLTASVDRPAFTALSVIAHCGLAYRIVIARRAAAAQRTLDFARFTELLQILGSRPQKSAASDALP